MNSLDKMEDYDRLAAALTKEKAKSKELRREVAMLLKYAKHGGVGGMCELLKHSDYECTCGLDAAINNTQATAEAYEREVAIKTLDDFGNRCGFGSTILLKMIAELRAANKGKEIV